jgi:hypothetical protein
MSAGLLLARSALEAVGPAGVRDSEVGVGPLRHVKRVTASEARKNWFRLLDEVAQGAVVCIERGGRRIVLRREPDAGEAAILPDYSDLLLVPGVDEADQWGWSWPGEGGDLEPEG